MIVHQLATSALLAVLLASVVGAQPSNPVTIDTSFGQVTGFTSPDGVDSFLGIQYANVGERFSRSSLIETQESQAVNATSYGPYCYQADVEGFTNYASREQDEECLYLNIWRPSNATSNSSLSTMVWIHGGGFWFGSGAEDIYKGTNLAQQHDVVVITLNYRLGLFGFLVTGENGQGGLNGIDDQINGLKWVKNHIASFGGNPDDVTIFGESAGSVSVCFLAVSPLAKGLFHHSIQQSGECVYGPTVVAKDATVGAQQTEMILNSTGASSVADLANATRFPAADIAPYSIETLMWWPTVDGLVLPDHPSQMYADSSNINPTDMIIGSTSYDSVTALFFPPEVNIAMASTMNDEIESTFGTELGAAIIEAYSPENYNGNAVAAYSQYTGDFWFRCASRAFVNLVSDKLSGKAFLYNYAYLSTFDPVVLNGLYQMAGINDTTWATHTADLFMVFGTMEEFPAWVGLNETLTPSTDDLAMSAEMMNRWVNFAKLGDPNSVDYDGWDPVSQETETVPPGKATSVPSFLLQKGGGQMSTVEEKIEQCSAFPFVVSPPEPSSPAPEPSSPAPEPTTSTPEQSSSADGSIEVATILLVASEFLVMVRLIS